MDRAHVVLTEEFGGNKPALRVNEVGGNSVIMRANSYWSYSTSPGHDMGHILGLYHQENRTNSLMSYSHSRVLTGNDLKRLAEGYR